ALPRAELRVNLLRMLKQLSHAADTLGHKNPFIYSGRLTCLTEPPKILSASLTTSLESPPVPAPPSFWALFSCSSESDTETSAEKNRLANSLRAERFSGSCRYVR